MPWARIDDGLYDHPKILAAGNEAVGLWLRMICYSNRHGTDGEVSYEACRYLAASAGVHWRTLARLLRRLCDVGLAHYNPARGVTEALQGTRKGTRKGTASGGSYTIHDFSDYNETSSEVADRRRVSRDRQRRHRARVTRDSRVSHTDLSRVTNSAPSRPVPTEDQIRGTVDEIAQSVIGQISGLGWPTVGYQRRLHKLLPVSPDDLQRAIDRTSGADRPNWEYLLKVLETPRGRTPKPKSPEPPYFRRIVGDP